MRSKHAVRKAGYTKDDVVNVTWIELPAGWARKQRDGWSRL